MKKTTIDPIEFLGKVGIYRESTLFIKVQVVGVRQPDLDYLFLDLEAIGDTLSVYENGQAIYSQNPEEIANFQSFELGGSLDMMRVEVDFIDVMYVGEIDFSPITVEKFSQQAQDYTKNFSHF